ncbi:BET1-like protein isoform X3 [Neofelis nebulosa]|uniref:BET1-like protein isoform X3 n=1 Tax=Neofelis nebulosa TaxID=61452 RepID=UPI002729516A|nr:BET1-like protein isoform X3 [Neofelis nebulosa]
MTSPRRPDLGRKSACPGGRGRAAGPFPLLRHVRGGCGCAVDGDPGRGRERWLTGRGSPAAVEEILDRENKRMADNLASKVTRLKSRSSV